MTVSKSRLTQKRSLSNRSLPNRSLFLKRAQRRGLTLVEIMIALTMTLIVLGAMMSAFRYASEKMQMGRGVMEMANRLRTAEELMRNDLANLTLEPRPYTEAATPNGFLEIIEGSYDDGANPNPLNATMVNGVLVPNNNASYLGDFDDSIGMTVRSEDGRRFRGVINNGAGPEVIESTVAEVWYFTTLNDVASNDVVATDVAAVDIEDSIRVHRRTLLIRPELGVIATDLPMSDADPNVNTVDTFVANNDISVRVVVEPDGEYSIVANTLADLALRQNRFAHLAPDLTSSNFPNSPSAAITRERLKPNGEDILLTDIAAFDVRVYSPNAEVRYTNGLLLEPGDPGYEDGVDAAEIGAFVDLGFKRAAFNLAENEWFGNPATEESGLQGGVSGVYDTWSPSYESDGIDQDNDDGDNDESTGADQGTNGLDDGGTAAPDDDAERETRPPYPNPIRGIQITTRIIEKTTQQVQQSSVVQSYVPE